MANFTLKLNLESKKARYLLGLITELAEEDQDIVMEPQSNAVTLKAMKEAEEGRVMNVNSIKELRKDLFDDLIHDM